MRRLYAVPKGFVIEGGRQAQMQVTKITDDLMELLSIPSPTGIGARAADYVARRLEEASVPCRRTRRGAVVVRIAGRSEGRERLRLSPIGGIPAASCEGAYCDVLTEAGPISGTILPDFASTHVFGERYHSLERKWENMRLRLDLSVENRADVIAAGVRIGDFIAIDPRPVRTPSGHIKSRFLDDKACAAALLHAAIEAAHGPKPPRTVHVHFSVYEENGQGAPAGLPDDLDEIVAVDMAAVGQGQASREDLVTVCVKDSGGPYDPDLSRRLYRIAEGRGVACAYDVYPYYSSDATAAARSGLDARIGLFGPGVDASHTHERTTETALLGTAEVALGYIEEEPA